MSRTSLTNLQRGVLERMRSRGLTVIADVVHRKWSNGECCNLSLAEHPRLEADFHRANAQVPTPLASNAVLQGGG
jgi:hypothetical protein